MSGCMELKKFRTTARQYPIGDGLVKYADPVWR